MTLFQHHLPSEVRIFKFSGNPTHVSSQAIVFDGVTTDSVPIYCRSYLFLERWLQVFMTLDENLCLKSDAISTFPFVFNCDFTTPHYLHDSKVFTTDLCVDILVGADGSSYKVKDADEFEEMYKAGYFGKQWYENAKQEVASLSGLLDKGQFLDFLNEVTPFPTIPTKAQPKNKLSVLRAKTP